MNVAVVLLLYVIYRYRITSFMFCQRWMLGAASCLKVGNLWMLVKQRSVQIMHLVFLAHDIWFFGDSGSV